MNSKSYIPIDQSFIDDLMVQIPEGTVDLRDDRINREWKVRINTFLLSSLPLETVSWIEAITFCNRLSRLLGLVPYYTIDKEAENIEVNQFASGIRLPTEAEWQYACQAGSKDVRYGDLETITWYKGNVMATTRKRSHPFSFKIDDLGFRIARNLNP